MSVGGLSAAQRRLDVISGNVANASTAGYAAVDSRTTSAGPAGARGGSSGVAVTPTRTFAQGPAQSTGQPFDLAISGEGFFQVSRPDGQRALTRAGRFGLDATGQLTTASGDRLVPPVSLPSGTDPSRVAIGSTGAITVNGQPAGQINLVSVADPGALAPAGDGTFAITPESGPLRPAPRATIEQGALEGSTADLADAAVGEISATTDFAANAVALRTQDEMLASLLGMVRR